MPSSASVDLPLVHISAEYIQDPASANITNNKLESFTDGVVLCQGSYLSAIAEIGSFEHSLTTDLLNHLVLVQKVFMKVTSQKLLLVFFINFTRFFHLSLLCFLILQCIICVFLLNTFIMLT